jgi:hypothetical protein
MLKLKSSGNRVLWLGLASCCWLSGCSSGSDDAPPADSTDSPASVSSTPDSSQGTGRESHATPEAVFAAFNQAAAEKDWATMASCLERESQVGMSLVMMIPAGLMAAFDPDAEKEFRELLQRNGLDEDQIEAGDPNQGLDEAIDELSASIENPAALLADIMKFLDAREDGEGGGGFGLSEGELLDLDVQGDTATATVKSEGQSHPIEFKKLNGSWKIRFSPESLMMDGGGPGEFPPPQQQLEFGFDSDNDSFDWGFEESDELPPPLDVTVENFQSWKVSVAVSEKAAGEVIQEQAAACGMELPNAAEFGSQLDQPVTLDLQDVSRLQVIEEACRQAGIHPRYRLRKLTFAAGPRTEPLAFSGPFACIVAKVEEFPPYGAGTIEMRILAAGLETGAVSYLKELNLSQSEQSSTLTHHIKSVEASDGSDLLSPQDRFGMSPSVSRTAFLLERKIGLRNLLRGVDSIAALESELSFEVPKQIESLAFESLETGTELKAGEVALQLKRVSIRDSGSSFAVSFRGTAPGRIKLIARSADGQPLKSFGHGSFSSGNQGELSHDYEGRAATLDVKLILDTERFRMPYVLRDIPLRRSSEQPEQIAPLSFEGEAPLAAKFVGMGEENGQRKITVELTNHSNKNIMALTMNVEYLGADGMKLDDFPHSQFGERDFLPAGETRELEIHAFFAPPETKSAGLRVQSAAFADETEWSREP